MKGGFAAVTKGGWKKKKEKSAHGRIFAHLAERIHERIWTQLSRLASRGLHREQARLLFSMFTSLARSPYFLPLPHSVSLS